MAQGLERAAVATKQTYETAAEPTEPGMTVIVRTHNDTHGIPGLFSDIAKQDYPGDYEVVVLDAESSDDTLDAVRLSTVYCFPEHVTVRAQSIEPADFANKALDQAIRSASYPLVMSLIGHTRLATNQAMHAAGHLRGGNAAAVYGLSLPGANASLSERIGARLLGTRRIVAEGAVQAPTTGKERGALAMDCTIIDVGQYKAIGGFNPAFEAGGADGELAARFAAYGHKIIRDPSLAVYHSHNLSPLRAKQQLEFWKSLDEPHNVHPGQTSAYDSGYDYCHDIESRLRS